MRVIGAALICCALVSACDNKAPATDSATATNAETPASAPAAPPETPVAATINDLATFPAATGLKAASVDGNAEVMKLGTKFQIADGSDKEHRYAVWRFSDAAPDTVYKTSVTVDKTAADTAGTLLRVAEVTAAGERKADCSFQVSTGETATRDAATTKDVAVTKGDGVLSVDCMIKTGAAPKGLNIYLLPAVGPNMTSYSETGTGMVTVRSLAVGPAAGESAAVPAAPVAATPPPAQPAKSPSPAPPH